MNDSKPKISIVMPCFNEEKHIAIARGSLVDEYVLETAKLPEFCYRGEEENRVSGEDLVKTRLLMAAEFAVMHVCWGVGFAGRFVKLAGKRRNR